MTVLFHGSFALNRQYMSGLLDRALTNPSLDDAELAKPFGYGAPFSQRYRSWLHKTGVTEMGLPMRLTPLGEVVIAKDHGFESLTTQWFLHHELTTSPERAEAWHYFDHDFLPKHSEFSKAELLDALTEKLRSHSEQHFGPGSSLNKQIATKIIQVYTSDSGLGQLGIITPKGKLFGRGKPHVLGPWLDPADLSKAY